jgi:hypothetical protein
MGSLKRVEEQMIAERMGLSHQETKVLVPRYLSYTKQRWLKFSAYKQRKSSST